MKQVLVLIAHGTVEDLSDLPAFLLEIRRGRPAPPELVAELEERYRAVGGSPHLAETERQARAMQVATGIEARVAMRLWHPKLSEVVKDLGPDDEILLLPLAPYSVEVYEAAARRELSARPDAPALRSVAPWGSLPELIDAHTLSIRGALDGLDLSTTQVILTAHSLPVAVIQRGDSYATEFEDCAQKVADKLGMECSVAYQSQGASAGAWLGPTLLETMTKARDAGKRHVAVAPIGFLAEHIETLYDLDIEAKAQAADLGLGFTRIAALGTDPNLIAAMARAVGEVEPGNPA